MVQIPRHEWEYVPEPETLEISQSQTRAASEDISLFRESGRTGLLRVITFLCVCVLLVLIALIAGAAIIALAFHYLSPWEWLNPDQLTAIRTFLFSGAVTGAVGWMGNYVRSRL